ncbi:BTB domain-containing protein [Mycena sanguinolenta]|uniref:BTB domain-containing protein n=1 Tax=Mycena sanguinolenta TaxID=230812 RepID=A0A8H6Z1D5_9AGAR|nr:BTB domain-containing protein [Mycena sanguinolenta]
MSSPSARQQAENEAITRSTDRWFSDGSIVLQAGKVQFRIHWGILALHSSVFRDMQGLPQPSDEPNVDGCPVVHLQDDPTDVEYLLKAIYDPTFLTMKKIPLPAVGALIRLGRKYDFKDYLNLAVARLADTFPTTFEAYLPHELLTTTITPYLGVFFDMITLASENDILSVLPAAYYYVICVYTQDELFQGREKLLMKQFQPGYSFGWALDATNVDGCTNPPKCGKAREKFMRDFVDKFRLFALSYAIAIMDMSQLCTACGLHAERANRAGRIKMWVELPRIFGLPPWDQLKNDL